MVEVSLPAPFDSPTKESLIKFSDVPKLPWLPTRRKGSRLNVSTLHRWAQKGRDGVMLKYVKVGGTRCTTEQWLREFFAQPGSGTDPLAEVQTSTPSPRPDNYAKIDLELTAEGL